MSPKLQHDELVMTVVETALRKPEEERLAYVRSACGDDTEVVTEVIDCLDWERRMNGFLLDPFYPPLTSESPFEPGDLLERRFRIVRELAQGGMGIVYEAMDEKLQRRIAIKCAKRGFRKRLPPEVRNASEISHPNICKIFEIHTAATPRGDLEFFTMEFLDGETLAERLRRGPLLREEAEAIALQVCAGLSEAHRKQVVHGDLKTSNIILTTDFGGKLRAVITDFGLARAPEGAARALPSGPLGGTPDYMAPELWKGAKLSVASDIYALGVILKEIASAKLAGSRWRKAIERCLQENPALRFPSADDVSHALMPHSRRWFAATAAAAVLAMFSGVVTYQAARAPAENVRLAVLPFEGGQDLGPLATRLNLQTSDVLRHLKASERTSLSVISGAAGASSTQRAGTAVDATHVLRASFIPENDRIVVRAWVTEAKSGVNARQWTAAYAESELSYVPVALAGVVTGTFHLPALTDIATVNAAARQDYQSGLQYLRRNSTVDSAVPLLERAVASDPGSPLTHAALAEGRWWKSFLTGDSMWRDRAAESLKEAEKRNPDLPEVHRIAGLLQADGGHYEQAVSRYSRAIELDPRNGDAYRRLGMAYDSDGEHDKALAAFRRAIEMDPEHYRNYQALGNFLHTRAAYFEALDPLRKAVELAPGEAAPHFVLGRAYMALGKYEDAEKALRESLALGETSASLNTLGAVLMYRGRDQEATQYFSRALSRFPEQYLWWMNLGTAYRRLNLSTEAERANRRALALVEAEVEKNPRNGYTRACLAYLCAWLGDRGRAESEIAQALQLAPGDNETRRMAVKTYEALGRREDSLAVLSTSPYDVLADVSRYPDLADLSRDSRFITMMGSSPDH